MSAIRNSLIISAGLLVGRLLGYGRELLIARSFGVTAQADGVILSLSLPEIFANFVASTALAYALMATGQRHQLTEQALYRRIRREFFYWGVIGAVCIAAVGAGMYRDDFAICVAICIAGISAIPSTQIGVVAGLLSWRRSFVPVAAGTILFHCAVIAGLVLTSHVVLVSLFIVAAAVLRWMFLMFRLPSAGECDALAVPPEAARDFHRAFHRALWTVSLIVLYPMVDRIFAATLTPGSLAIFSFAEKLAFIPISLFLTTHAVASLPDFVELGEDVNRARIRGLFNRSFVGTFVLSVATAGCLWFLSDLVVVLLYGWTDLSQIQLEHIGATLRGFAGIIGVSGPAATVLNALLALEDRKGLAMYAWGGAVLRVASGAFVGIRGLEPWHLAWGASSCAVIVTAWGAHRVYSYMSTNGDLVGV